MIKVSFEGFRRVAYVPPDQHSIIHLPQILQDKGHKQRLLATRLKQRIHICQQETVLSLTSTVYIMQHFKKHTCGWVIKLIQRQIHDLVEIQFSWSTPLFHGESRAPRLSLSPEPLSWSSWSWRPGNSRPTRSSSAHQSWPLASCWTAPQSALPWNNGRTVNSDFSGWSLRWDFWSETMLPGWCVMPPKSGNNQQLAFLRFCFKYRAILSYGMVTKSEEMSKQSHYSRVCIHLLWLRY